MVMGGMPGRAERLSYAEYTDGTQDAQSVIEQLKKAVFRGRIRMTEFFSDFDPLRTGAMSAHKFRTALVACGAVHLTERQLQVLTLHFIDPADSQRVRYLDLLTEIETVFTTANMQYDPFSTGNDFTPALIKDTTTLPPAHEEAVMTVLARLAHLVKVLTSLPPAAPRHRCASPPLCLALLHGSFPAAESAPATERPPPLCRLDTSDAASHSRTLATSRSHTLALSPRLPAPPSHGRRRACCCASRSTTT